MQRTGRPGVPTPLTPFLGRHGWIWAVALAFAIRIPQMVSPHWIADGDESIVGLMAVHILRGKGFPFFFYGQAYGFSLFESGVAALLLSLGTALTWALKLTAFLWFSVGLIGWQVWGWALREDRGRNLTLGILIAVLLPWGLWALKARGGYATAFGLLPWSLWLLSGSSIRRRFLAGVLTAIILFSQPFFLAGWVPWAIWHLHREKGRSGVLSWASGLALTVLLVRFTSPGDHAYWAPHVFGTPTAETFRVSLVNLVLGLSGSYSFFGVRPSNTLHLLLVAVSLLLVTWLTTGWIKRLRSDPIFSPGSVAMVSLFASMAYVPLLISSSPRYFLPVAVFLGLAVWINAPRLVIGFWIVLNLAATFTLESRAFMAPPLPAGTTEERAMEDLLAELREKDIRGLYSMHSHLQWQVMYYSRDEIPARWVEPADRVPEYPMKVDRALFSGKPVAVVGFVNGEGYREWKDRPFFQEVARRYFLVTGPDPETLRSMGFRLNE